MSGKAVIFSLLFVCVVTSPLFAQSADDAVTPPLGAGVTFASRDVSRGILQTAGSAVRPSVWATKGPFTVTSELLNDGEQGWRIQEHALTLEYAREFRGWTVAAAWGHAFEPGADHRVTQELSTTVTFDQALQPELSVAQDFGATTGSYYAVAVAPSIAVRRSLSLAMRAELGYNHHQDIEASRLTHVELTCAVQWQSGSRLVLRPFVTRVQSFYQREVPHRTIAGMAIASR